KFLILFLIILTILIYFFPVQDCNRFTIRPDTWGDRLDLWLAALNIFKDYPIFGSGPGTFEKFLYVYGPQHGYKEGAIHLHSHNTYLEILSDTGLMGFMSLIILLSGFFRLVFAVLNLKRDVTNVNFILGFTAGIISTLILASATSIIFIGFQDAAVFWLMMGIVMGMCSKYGKLPSIGGSCCRV
ncbi:MAG: O-antigen ligase family protein, partial [Candidatus Omnitrophica bacterium]|nr:O-antigen ligase family protein [Candidatus Omnitrophota bacterium]